MIIAFAAGPHSSQDPSSTSPGPRLSATFRGATYSQASAGHAHTVLLQNDHHVVACGRIDFGLYDTDLESPNRELFQNLYRLSLGDEFMANEMDW